MMKLSLLVSVIGLALSIVSVKGATGTSSSSPSLCDKYSLALFNSTNATTQSTLLTALVNTAVIGSYSPLGDKAQVGGILAEGTYNGTSVSLLKYFDGSLKSTNVKGRASAVNFLDGGGATPLKENKPANDTTSAQYVLLTHLYEYFGQALGCSSQSHNGAFKTYQGVTSMSRVHRFMNLNEAEVGYFIAQVGLSAASFGVVPEDIAAVATLLGSVFGFRCSPPVAFPPGARPASQAICVASTCPLSKDSDCKADVSARSYPNGTSGVAPSPASGSAATNDSSTGGTATNPNATTDGTNTTGTPASGAAPLLQLGSLTLAHLADVNTWTTFAGLGLGALGVATLL